MSNTVTITENLSYTINNPTKYSPDAVISRYVQRQCTDIQIELRKLRRNGVSENQLAQNLFARAVDDIEFQNYKCAGIRHCCFGGAFLLLSGLLALIAFNSNWDKGSAMTLIFMLQLFAALEALHAMGNLFLGPIIYVLKQRFAD